MDRYTKIVLTIIAASLAGLLATQPAQAQIGGGCGESQLRPCYIQVVRL